MYTGYPKLSSTSHHTPAHLAVSVRVESPIPYGPSQPPSIMLKSPLTLARCASGGGDGCPNMASGV
ncbi:hypothetical protein EYF80_022596 [Liparis tanakae]|uniref:Uncharacterized protein n=1 Tax=Liparis tanakae TaxID=230148 RepID=A0A4Z2HMT5_9TELE|nr:hypothetical protein EYF80_022596 [Liparis tanakae]